MKLPSYFFNPSQLIKALLNIRPLIAKGLTPVEVMDEILHRYYNTNDQTQRELLKKLYVSVREFESKFPVPELEPESEDPLPDTLGLNHDRTYAYQLLKRGFQESRKIKWLEEFSSELTLNPTICRGEFKHPLYWMVVPLKQKENVLTLSKDAGLHCIVEPDLTINLIVMANNIGRYSINETPYNMHPPLYHAMEDDEDFTSPVYKVKVARKILEYCLQRVGYPYVRIRMKVIFTEPNLILINFDDYLREGKDWKDVEVTLVSNLDPKQGFLLNCPYKNLLFAAKDVYDREMIRMLYSSLSATSKIYSWITEGDDNNLIYHTAKDMKYWADEAGVFVSKTG